MTDLSSLFGGIPQTTNYGSFKNKVINPTMDIAQRGATIISPANATFTLDRWWYGKSGAMVHAQRDGLLTQSDWTQLVDSPLSDPDKATFSVYRQDLRDVPQDYPTGSGIEWPEVPTY